MPPQIVQHNKDLCFITKLVFIPCYNNGDEVDVQLVLVEIDDLTSIECSLQTIQSLAFIAGYRVHKYKIRTQPCHVCIDLLTIDKDFIFDEGP